MDTYIRTLIEVIEANGKEDKGRPDALLTITFGQLFELTANVFDSLVGIIKTARKCVTNRTGFFLFLSGG
eukprot:m.326416 g.326416  ORF g.326416 m.326416 type:complete len:70 (-) comp16480_c0_seq6:761-970(-)